MPEAVTPVAGTPAPAGARQTAHSQVLPVARESRAPAAAAARHPVVQAIDHAAELAFVIIAGVGWILGKTTFEFFAGASFLVMGVQTGIRRAGDRGALPPVNGAVGLAIIGLGGAYLRSRGLLTLLGALALAAVGATALTGCSAAPALATVIKPSGFGVRNDPRFGRCYSAGASVGGQFEATVHICGHFLDGGALPPPGDQTLPPIAITADGGAE